MIHPSVNGEGTLIDAKAPSEPPPTEISPADMELMMAFQQDVVIAQRAYSTLMGQFSARYQLREGDRIGMDRQITRKE
jgi:hypothetical protein